MYVSALIVYSVVFYILYVDGPPTHPGQYLWHRLPYATSRPRLAYRRYLSLSVCMCFCLLADVSLDQTLVAALPTNLHREHCTQAYECLPFVPCDALCLLLWFSFCMCVTFSPRPL